MKDHSRFDESNTPSDDAVDVEGLDDQSPSWGDYPIDTLLIRHEQRTIYEVLRRINRKSYVMDPDFQREFIWPEDKQSKLIESVLMRLPLPVFYLAEDKQGRMIVVDGLQRLSTFSRFVNNELQLNLPDHSFLNKKTFDTLTPKLQNRIEDCNLILYIIDAKVHERARLDIFERVNGGVPLTRQQMRNCLYMGKATQFLKEEANTELFVKATGRSLRTSTMRDREFVNRFCAFQLLDIKDYRGDMDAFLASALEQMNSEPEYLPALSQQFTTTLHNNLHLFGKHAFRKHYIGQERRNIINASLWDVMSTGLSLYPQHVVAAHSDILRSEFYNLMNDHNFIDSITRAPNSVKPVRRRFRISKHMLTGILDA